MQKQDGVFVIKKVLFAVFDSYKLSMKKISFFVLLMVVMSVGTLAACSNGLSGNKSVSEYRDNYYVGSGNSFSVEAMTGFREAPFVIDGVSGDKSDFCLVTVKPKNFDPTREYGYKLTLNGSEYEGDLVKHPFENTYSFEIPVRADADSFIVEIDGEQIELNTIKTENYISPEKAFEIAKKRLSDCKILAGRNEIYVRLIANPVNATGGYFWYVAFVNENKDTAAVLIHPESMEIIAVRE